MPGINKTVLGPTVILNGEIELEEDLFVEGHIRAKKIDVKNHSIVVGKGSTIEADIFAKMILICGKVNGNVTATEEVHLPESGVLVGDIAAPRIQLAKRANFKGRITYT